MRQLLRRGLGPAGRPAAAPLELRHLGARLAAQPVVPVACCFLQCLLAAPALQQSRTCSSPFAAWCCCACCSLQPAPRRGRASAIRLCMCPAVACSSAASSAAKSRICCFRLRRVAAAVPLLELRDVGGKPAVHSALPLPGCRRLAQLRCFAAKSRICRPTSSRCCCRACLSCATSAVSRLSGCSSLPRCCCACFISASFAAKSRILPSTFVPLLLQSLA